MATKAIVGEKVGMTQVWDDDNRVVPVTVLKVAPCRVVQVKTDRARRLHRPAGHLRPQERPQARPSPRPATSTRPASSPGTRLVELRLDDVDGYEVGQEIKVDLLADGDRVDVTAVSKGKGFAGVMKRHNFTGQGASHGAHRVHRAPGSIGACATPARVFKGTRMAGRMGGEKVTTLNLEVVAGRRRARPAARQGRRARPQGRPRAHPRRREGRGEVSHGQRRRARPPPAPRPGSVELDDAIFGIEPNVPVMHQVVTAQLAARRAGHAEHQDPRRGRAAAAPSRGSRRAPAAPAQGSIRSPHWRGGGVALGPKPRSYAQRTPKKMIRLALRSALSDRAAEGKVVVVDGWGFDAPKTKDAVAALAALGVEGRVARRARRRRRRGAAKSFRNLPDVQLLERRRAQRLRRARARLVVFTQDTLPAQPTASSRRRRRRHRGGRASREGPPRRHHRAGREREVLRAARARTSTRSSSTPTPPSPRSTTPSRRSSA